MLAGHMAAGLALKRVDKEVNLAYLLFAAFFLDFVLGVFVLLDIERIIIPYNFEQLHYLRFEFPFSHSLVGSVLWSGLAFLLAFLFSNANKLKHGLVMAVAVFSHFVLDFVVHADMTIIGLGSSKIGLGLWNYLGLSLALEVVLVLVGLAIYQTSSLKHNPKTRYGVSILALFMLLVTVLGQAFSKQPPPSFGAAVSWIVQALLIAGIAYWLDRKSQPANPFK